MLQINSASLSKSQSTKTRFRDFREQNNADAKMHVCLCVYVQNDCNISSRVFLPNSIFFFFFSFFFIFLLVLTSRTEKRYSEF